jgi:hypothetical protein
LAIQESTLGRPGKGVQALPGNSVKSGEDVEMTQVPGVLWPYKSKPYLVAVFPDLWSREKWPKSSYKDKQ